ncbi:MAG: polymerase sigma factor, sigma-70 family [Gemmatimonadetes bacterium]|nr:polymerase sigma factor, sigma-70 family [Gemmatimonadota bacterium]
MGTSTLFRIALSHGADMETQQPASLPPAAAPLDERALLDRARRGDARAQRGLYDLHVDRIYRLTFRMTGSDDLARDMTQDTFVSAFAGLDRFRGDSAFSSWLHSIAVSVTLNGLKRRKRLWSREHPLDEAQAVAGTVVASDPLLKARLAEAVSLLPERCRTVFLMHDAEGFTHEQIASALGVTVGTSKAQLSRGRATLRVALASFAKEWES